MLERVGGKNSVVRIIKLLILRLQEDTDLNYNFWGWTYESHGIDIVNWCLLKIDGKDVLNIFEQYNFDRAKFLKVLKNVIINIGLKGETQKEFLDLFKIKNPK